jgi:hypothetical protein
MVRYIARIGELGTIKATSMQPYLSAMNGFFKDHDAEPFAQGDLVAKVRRGLAASQVSLQTSRTRMYPLARILVSLLRLAKDLVRTQLIETWTHALTDLIILFNRTCLATVLVSTFFVEGERELSAGLETCRVLQPVESSSTKERENVNGVLPRSETSYVNYRSQPTLT